MSHQSAHQAHLHLENQMRLPRAYLRRIYERKLMQKRYHWRDSNLMAALTFLRSNVKAAITLLRSNAKADVAVLWHPQHCWEQSCCCLNIAASNPQAA